MAEMEEKAKFETPVDRFWSDFNQALIKAVSKPESCFLYGLVCKNFSERDSSTRNFRKSIIARCLLELENCSRNGKLRVMKAKEIEKCTDTEKKRELQTLYENEGKSLRMKSIGTISLMKELWSRRMLKKKIMHFCISHLLQNRDEENLEFLYKLLKEIGEKLEFNGDLQGYFKMIQVRINDQGSEKISPRIREMLEELVALRANKWVPQDSSSQPELPKLAEPKKTKKENSDSHEKPFCAKVRRILDHYNSKNIDTVASKIISLPIKREDLRGFIKILMEKSFVDVDLTKDCVLLCKKLSSMEVPGTVAKNETWKDFERLFAVHCVKKFEHYLEEAKDLKKAQFSNLREVMKSSTYASLIGELFNEDIICQARVKSYIDTMLKYKTEENLARLYLVLDNIQEKLVHFDNLTNYVDELQEILDERDSGRFSEECYEVLEKTVEWLDLLLLTPEQMFMSTMEMFREMR
ncbi:eukaryotic translation initiation factor 4 gamma 1-like isoform X2 [Belonocnema kinseyi]|uniref:eukaryotic translation initiation factor 4 gamma 1-like isoform X2 n=1 Tax=Belonocnema kinseyi TaxID=2817044 RepID=UPI00143DD6C8|nr:eukaryotic translation initiation factor 4 gamma 1-like isoform X2 [Belonocnema kinseyi]